MRKSHARIEFGVERLSSSIPNPAIRTAEEKLSAMAMDQFPNDPFRTSASCEDDAQDRNAARDSLFLMAELRIGTTVTTVRVRNLSAGGLMAEYPLGLAEDAVVECDLRGVGVVRGRVAWSAAGRIGIAFERPIDPLMARKPVGTGAKPKIVLWPKYPPHR
jgi:hypothetical protein